MRNIPFKYTPKIMHFPLMTTLMLASVVVRADPFSLAGLCDEPTAPMLFRVHGTVDGSANDYDAEYHIPLNMINTQARVVCGDTWSRGHGAAGTLYYEDALISLCPIDAAGVCYDAGTTTTYEVVEMYPLGGGVSGLSTMGWAVMGAAGATVMVGSLMGGAFMLYARTAPAK